MCIYTCWAHTYVYYTFASTFTLYIFMSIKSFVIYGSLLKSFDASYLLCSKWTSSKGHKSWNYLVLGVLFTGKSWQLFPGQSKYFLWWFKWGNCISNYSQNNLELLVFSLAKPANISHFSLFLKVSQWMIWNFLFQGFLILSFVLTFFPFIYPQRKKFSFSSCTVEHALLLACNLCFLLLLRFCFTSCYVAEF